jgi:hypothetical protein
MLLAALGSAVAVTTAAGGLQALAADQPVQFNHKLHVQEQELACTDCHEGTETRARAGFPPDDFCRGCHEEALGESPEEARLVELLQGGVPLAWHQVTRVADYVLFSHRRHVALGNIDCSVCHGDMREQTRPITKPAVSFEGRAGMFRCLGCHLEREGKHTGIDCLDCHR